MSERRVPVIVELEHFAATEGTAIVVERTLRERAVRAALALAVCWAGALLCVFIPLLHFVLVPGLLTTGVALLFLRLRETTSMARLEAPCPRCKESRVMETGGPYRNGRRVRCDQCGRELTLCERSTPAPAS